MFVLLVANHAQHLERSVERNRETDTHTSPARTQCAIADLQKESKQIDNGRREKSHGLRRSHDGSSLQAVSATVQAGTIPQHSFHDRSTNTIIR
jgi:hypothetical protein